MRKALLRADALSALVLGEIRKRDDCRDVRDINIRSCTVVHPITGAYWAPTGLDPGISATGECTRELWRVCHRLGGEYELAP